MAKAVMVPLIVSHDEAIHRDSVRRWKDFAPDIKVDWVGMAQNVLRYNVVIVGKFFNNGSWVSEAWRKARPQEFEEELERSPGVILTAEERKSSSTLALVLRALRVCGPRARNLHTALG